MKKPEPLKPKQLSHPKDQRSRWNGDKWRNELKGSFNTRVSSVSGTRPPSNARSVSMPSISSPEGVDITGRSNDYQPAFRPDLEALKAQQMKMLKKKK